MSAFKRPEEVLPHRAPFLFIDEVIEMGDTRIVAVRTFRGDEAFFKGHFPDRPIVPGVLLVEGLAQTMAYFALTRRPAERVFLVGIDRARFRGMVEPGALVRYEVEIGDERFGTLHGKGRVKVAERRIADADLMGYAGDAGGIVG